VPESWFYQFFGFLHFHFLVKTIILLRTMKKTKKTHTGKPKKIKKKKKEKIKRN